MRRIERTAQFKRDYKREAKGPHQEALANALVAIVKALADDKPRPATGKTTGTATSNQTWC